MQQRSCFVGCCATAASHAAGCVLADLRSLCLGAAFSSPWNHSSPSFSSSVAGEFPLVPCLWETLPVGELG